MARDGDREGNLGERCSVLICLMATLWPASHQSQFTQSAVVAETSRAGCSLRLVLYLNRRSHDGAALFMQV